MSRSMPANINWNTVIQGVVLLLLSWVISSANTLSKSVTDLKIQQAVTSNDVQHLKAQFNQAHKD